MTYPTASENAYVEPYWMKSFNPVKQYTIYPTSLIVLLKRINQVVPNNFGLRLTCMAQTDRRFQRTLHQVLH